MKNHLKILLLPLLFLAIQSHAQSIGCDSCTTQAKGNTKIHKAITWDTLTATQAFKNYYGNDTAAMIYVDATTDSFMVMLNGVSYPLTGSGGGGSVVLPNTQIAFGTGSGIASDGNFTYNSFNNSDEELLSVGWNGISVMRVVPATGGVGNSYFGGDSSTFPTYLSVNNPASFVAVNGSKATAYTPATPNVNFTGTGLNDMTNISGVDYTGQNGITYTVTIDGVSPDTYTWTDGTTTLTNNPIFGGAATLNNAIQIDFGSTTGHTLGDSWNFEVAATYGEMMSLDGINQGFFIGDVDNVNTGAAFGINANAGVWSAAILDDNGRYLNIAEDDQLYQMGDIDGFGNNCFADVDDANLLYRVNIGGDTNLEIGANFETIGDVNGVGHGTLIKINDVTKLITISNVPIFANDAAAISGGLTQGQLYQTTTLGITALNIIPITP